MSRSVSSVNPEISATTVLNGSLVKSDRGYLFLCVALGKAVVDGIAVIALSPQSPLGQKLMGLKVGEVAIVNSTSYLVIDIE